MNETAPHARRAFHDLFPDGAVTRARFGRVRGSDGLTCYHCGTIGDAASVSKTKFRHCKACKGQFSVTPGTPMRCAHPPLRTWAQTISLSIASSKGISVVNPSEMPGVVRQDGVAPRSPIRAMMAENSPRLSAIVEIDEMVRRRASGPSRTARRTISRRPIRRDVVPSARWFRSPRNAVATW